MVYPKDRQGTTGIGVADIGLQTNAVQFDGIGCNRVGEEVEVTVGRIDRLLGTYEIGPQNRLIGKGCNRTASYPFHIPFMSMQIEIMN